MSNGREPQRTGAVVSAVHGPREARGKGLAEVVTSPRTLDQVTTAVSDGRLGPVVQNHHEAGVGRVFVAIRGHHMDARSFAGAAARAGCAAVVGRGEPPPDWPPDTACAWIRVGDDRRALSRLAAAQHGHPSRQLGITAITGTNGKTTVTYLLEAIWRAAGIPTGRIGTVEVRIGDQSYPPVLTTPDPLDLHGWLRRMLHQGVREVAMEASSHALSQHRIDDVAIDVAVLTNVRRDHLDFHRTHQAYRDAKGRLFTRLLGRQGTAGVAILPQGEPASAAFAHRTPARVVWYGIGGEVESDVPKASIVAEDLSPRRWGTRFRLCLPDQSRMLDLPLAGRFNVLNALAAGGAAHARGITLDHVAAGLEHAVGAPGRVAIMHDGEFAVLLDFAHNPDALAEVVHMAHELTRPPGRVHCVMGAEGEKDRGKRPLMGEAAGRYADVLWVTSDSPRGEDPEGIVAQVAAGAWRTSAHVICDPNRRRTIARAVAAVRPGDTLVVCGRGPETVQVVAGRCLRWSDAGAIRAALVKRLSTRDKLEEASACAVGV